MFNVGALGKLFALPMIQFWNQNYPHSMQAGYVLSIHYLVLSTKGGTQMDIGMTLKVIILVAMRIVRISRIS